jgi:cytochrome c5
MTQLAPFILAAILYTGLVSGPPPSQANQANVVHSQNPKASNNHAQPTGDSVFQANCARCHTPPMTLSPRITGTVIMHMRTRARLSRQDEQLLLKYLAP